MLNCTTDTMDNSHFSKWTPLMGIYIATATFVCVAAIIGDLVKGLRRKQYWIPSEYVSLNSISLTILGAATKLSMDLSTAMPRHTDQLTKLGTSTFMCVALASIHPSLGKLENSELLSNTVALFVLVISSIISLCIQLRTGVIYAFKTAHIIMLTMMTFLLLQCVSLAVRLSFAKCLYQNQYQALDRSAQEEWIGVEENKHLRMKKLEEYLRKFSMWAHSGCPHFLSVRSFVGTLPPILGVVAAIAFFSTQITSMTHGHKFLASTSGTSISAYNWSVLWILMAQTIALGVGSIILCIRGCYFAMVYLKGEDSPSGKAEQAIKSEQFWMKIDENAAATRFFADFIDNSQHKGLVYKLMIPYTYLCFYFCWILVKTNNTIFPIFKLFYRCIVLFCFFATRRCITCKLHYSPNPTIQSDDLASEVKELSKQYISPFLGEKEGWIQWITKSISSITQKYMSAKERKTEHLEELLTQYLSPNFEGGDSFDSVEIAPLDGSQGSPPNCWSLPVVTLTHIAIALPNVDRRSIVKLRKAVNEGLVFAKLIEDKFNNQPQLYNARYAAYTKWKGGYGPWFKDGVRPAFQNKRPIEGLKCIATSGANEFKNDDRDAMEQVADHSLYRLCKTILLEYGYETQHDEVSTLEEHRNKNIELTQDDGVYPSSERIFQKLRATIADILGACLTNLNRYILMECSSSSSIEKRREAACHILKFFGDTKKIMEIVEAKEIPDISPEKLVFIDEWRKHYQQQRHLP